MEGRPIQTRTHVLVIASLVLSIVSLYVSISGVSQARGPGSITGADIKDNSIYAIDLHGKSVTSEELAANAVTTYDIATNTVRSVDIKNDTLSSADYAPQSIDTAAIRYYSIGLQNLQVNSVDSSKIANDTVASSDLGNGEVTVFDIGPVADSKVSVANLPMTDFIDSANCHTRFAGVTYDSIDHVSNQMFDPSKPSILTAPFTGIYTVTVAATWANPGATPGNARHLLIPRITTDGSLTEGGREITTVPAANDRTAQLATFEMRLAAGEGVKVIPFACGANVQLNEASLALAWSHAAPAP